MITNLPPRLQAWIAARKRFRLSDAHVQMARELQMNPDKLGKLADHRDQPWKAPLPDHIEHLYRKRFGRDRPARVVSIEERFLEQQARKAEQRARRLERRARERAAQAGGEPDR